MREATARAAESKLVQRASLLARDSKVVAGVATGLRSAKARAQQAQQRAAGKMDQLKRRAGEEEKPSPEPSPEPSPGQTQAEAEAEAAAAAAAAPAPPPAPPAAHAAAAASAPGKPPAGKGKGKGDGKLKGNRLHDVDVDDDDDDDDEDGGFVYERAATNGPPAVAAGSGPVRRTVGVVQSNER